MKLFIKISLAILIAGALLITGCAVLVGGAVDEAGKSIKKEQNQNAITNAQARTVKLGTKKSVVIAKFGPPESSQEGDSEGLGKDSCIYYNIRNGEVLDNWQFCFNNKNRLDGKNRL